MMPSTRQFLIKRSELSTLKMFVEFYQPESLKLLRQLREGAYHARPLAEVSLRLFDGPFGSDRKIEMYQSSGVPYIRVKDVLPEGIDQRELMYISQAKHEDFSRSRVVPGNVLMTIAGRVGTAAVFPAELVEGNITGHIVGIELPNTINAHYLAAFINSELGQFQIARWAHRTTRPELNLFEVGQILIPVPPRPVQDRIAALMQEAYAARRRMLAEAEKLFLEIDSYLLSALGISLTKLQSERIILKPVHEISGGRFDFEAVVTLPGLRQSFGDTVVLKKVCQHVYERTTPLKDNPDGEIKYVSLGNIASKTGELVDSAPVRGSDILSSSPKFERGDILFGRMRPYLNKVWLAEFDGVCSGEAIVLRPDTEEVDSIFLHALLLSQVTLDQVVPLQSGTALPRVSAFDVLSVNLPIPSDKKKQKTIGLEISRRRAEARRLRTEAERVVAEAKARVERMILGEEAAV